MVEGRCLYATKPKALNNFLANRSTSSENVCRRDFVKLALGVPVHDLLGEGLVFHTSLAPILWGMASGT